MGASPSEIIWTSGATESNNLALFGIMRELLPAPCHLITQVTEHPAVLDACRQLEQLGVSVTYLPVDRSGRISLTELEAAIRPETALVSIMTANNEIGAIQPIREIGEICRAAGVLFHTDATQAVGRLPIDVATDGISLLSLSAHKLYGPKGAGALYVRSDGPRFQLHPLFFGGGHERGMRSGTINVPGVVGLGEACEIAGGEMSSEWARLETLRDQLENAIESQISDVHVNARSRHRMPHVTNIAFCNVDGSALLRDLPDIALSVGSACSSLKKDASHVLIAIGVDSADAAGSLRFSLGRSNDEAQVATVVGRIREAVHRARHSHPGIEIQTHISRTASETQASVS